MRTTITLDDDVAARIHEEMRERGATFKGTLNDLLREGLQYRTNAKRVQRFKARPRAMGSRIGIDYDNIGDLLEQTEGASHR